MDAGGAVTLAEGAAASEDDTLSLQSDATCAVLYTDGELVFQASSAAKTGKTIETTFSLPTGASPAWNGESGSRAETGAANKVKKVTFEADVAPTSLTSWFSNCQNLEEIIGMKEHLNTSNVTEASAMFYCCTKLKEIDLSGFNCQKLQKADVMFAGCKALTTLDASSMNTPALTTIEGMFNGCANLETLNLAQLDLSKVTAYQDNRNAGSFFTACNKLSTVALGADFRFVAGSSYNNYLPTPSSTDPYNGKWAKQGTTQGYTPSDLAAAFNANPTNMAGTWVWQDESAQQPEPAKTDITGAAVTLSSTSFTYSGSEQKPTVSQVKAGNTVVPAGSYGVSYSGNCTDAGTYTVTVTGAGDYEGTAAAQFAISPKAITADMIDAIPDQAYTGGNVEPAPVVRFNDAVVASSNFDVTYQSNVNVGTAKAVVTAKANTNFASSAEKTFQIVKKANQYVVGRDTWSFKNFMVNGIPKDYCKRLFGDSYGQTVYEANIGSQGMCYGMSASAQASNVYSYPAVSSYMQNGVAAATLSDADLTQSRSSQNGYTAIANIAWAHLAQKDWGTIWERIANADDYDGLVAAIKSAQAGEGAPVCLEMYGSGSVGHALWALKVTESASEDQIKVYDSNMPDNGSSILRIAKTNGTRTGWSYTMDGGSTWGGAKGSEWMLTWDTPSDELKGMYDRNGVYDEAQARWEGFEKYMLVRSTSAINMTANGSAHELSPSLLTRDDKSVLHTPSTSYLPSGAQSESMDSAALPGGELYWVASNGDFSVGQVSQATSLSIAANDGGVDVELPANSSMKATVDEGEKNSVTIAQPSGSTFSITYFDDEDTSASGGLESITVSGIGSSTVVTEQVGDDVSVRGASSLTLTNEQGTVTQSGLSPAATYTIHPTGGTGGEPSVASVVKRGRWGSCDWEIDSDGVITVHPGTGDDQTWVGYSDLMSPWRDYTYHNIVSPGESHEPELKATKIVFAEENGNKVIAPAKCNGLLWGMCYLKEIDVSGLDTSNTTTMAAMFSGCSEATAIKGLAGFNTSKVTDMQGMFGMCTKLTSIDVSSFDTRNVTDMSLMFNGCAMLKSMDLSSFNTAKLSDSTLANDQLMFLSCNNLEHVALGKETTKLTELRTGYNSENWISMSTGVPYSTEQIKSSRLGVADSYVKTDGLTDLAYAYIEGPADVTYNGSAQEPVVTVKMYSNTLTRNTDYTATYSNNTNVGTAKVQIVGNSTYTGAIAKTFLVKAKPATPTTPSTKPSTPSTPATKPMYRLYNPNSGEHFYTEDASERDHLASVGWTSEGVGWRAPTAGQDVYRLYNAYAGDHHYTPDASERDHLVSVGWSFEGVGWKSGGSVPLYRQYNPNAKAGSHNYTTSKSENDWLVSLGWRAEGVGWYGVS